MLPDMASRFIQCQPKPLGVVQIMTGLLTALLGLIVFFSDTKHGTIPVWIGLVYVLPGALCVAAHKGTNRQLIKGTLGSCIIGFLVALVGVIFFCIRVTVWPIHSGCLFSSRWNDYYGYYRFFRYRRPYTDCGIMEEKYRTVVDGIHGLLLVLSVLEFSVAVAVAIYACKALSASNDQQGDSEKLSDE